MNILQLIGQIFKPAVDLVDEMHTSEEERLAIKASTLDTYVKALETGLAYEQENLSRRAAIVEAEAKSDHVLTSTWRPITMLAFLGLVICDSFGWLANPLAPQAWTLLQIGLGGYVVGRSAEKVGVPIVEALKGREK